MAFETFKFWRMCVFQRAYTFMIMALVTRFSCCHIVMVGVVGNWGKFLLRKCKEQHEDGDHTCDKYHVPLHILFYHKLQ